MEITESISDISERFARLENMSEDIRQIKAMLMERNNGAEGANEDLPPMPVECNKDVKRTYDENLHEPN